MNSFFYANIILFACVNISFSSSRSNNPKQHLSIEELRTPISNNQKQNQLSIEELVARETKVDAIQKTPKSMYDPSDCIIKNKDSFESVTNIGITNLRRRNFAASSDCMHTAVQSWFSGVQSGGYIDKVGRSGSKFQNINRAMKHLKTQETRNMPRVIQEVIDNSEKNDAIDHPQIPPQLIYEKMQQLKLQKKQENDSKEHNSIKTNLVKPKLVIERERNRMEANNPRNDRNVNNIHSTGHSFDVSRIIELANNKESSQLTPDQKLIKKLALQTLSSHGASSPEVAGPYKRL
jgi:hypothetical protein